MGSAEGRSPFARSLRVSLSNLSTPLSKGVGLLLVSPLYR